MIREGVDPEKYVFSSAPELKEEMTQKKGNATNSNANSKPVALKKRITAAQSSGGDGDAVRSPSSTAAAKGSDQKNSSSEISLDHSDVIIIDNEASDKKELESEKETEVDEEVVNLQENDDFDVDDMEEIDQVGVVDEEDGNFSYMAEEGDLENDMELENDTLPENQRAEEEKNKPPHKSEKNKRKDEEEKEEVVEKQTLDDQYDKDKMNEERKGEEDMTINGQLEQEEEMARIGMEEGHEDPHPQETAIINGVDPIINDTEEGINLTIEEDEQQLLHDAVIS